MAIDIKAARIRLAALYKADIVTATSLAQELYAYRVGDFKGQSPISILATGSIDNADTDASGDIVLCDPDYTSVTFQLLHLVLYYDPDSGTWSDEEAEDRLNDISTQTMATTHTIQQATTYTEWDDFIMATSSPPPSVVEIGGIGYLRRIFTLRVGK